MNNRNVSDSAEPESPLSEIDARFSAARSHLTLLEELLSKLTNRLTPVINAVPVPDGTAGDSDHEQLSPLATEMLVIENRIANVSRRIAQLLDQIAL